MNPGRELDALVAEKIFGEDQTPRDVVTSNMSGLIFTSPSILYYSRY